MVFSSILSPNIKVNGNILLSSQNKPNNSSLDDKDFTIDHYTELLLLAKKNFKIASYDDKEFSENSLLWRHDVDFSLIHSLVLAKKATKNIRKIKVLYLDKKVKSSRSINLVRYFVKKKIYQYLFYCWFRYFT